MNATEQEAKIEQEALMNMLLEGADPDAYVVISVAALERQIDIMLQEERRECRCKSGCRQMDRGRMVFKLIRTLDQLGFTKSKRGEW